MASYFNETFKKYINSNIKESGIYPYFCDASTVRMSLLNKIDKKNSMWIYKSKSPIFDELVNGELLLFCDLTNEYELYGDKAFCAIANGGNEILISGSFTSASDTYLHRTHLKYFTDDFGTIKCGESLLVDTIIHNNDEPNIYVVHVDKNNKAIMNTQFELYAKGKNPNDYPVIYDFIKEYEQSNIVKKKEL